MILLASVVIAGPSCPTCAGRQWSLSCSGHMPEDTGGLSTLPVELTAEHLTCCECGQAIDVPT